MKEEMGWSGALGAAIVVTIFASLAIAAGGGWGWVIEAAKWLDFTSGSTLASWAQAVFSFAAVVVALRIAGGADRRKQKEDEDRAGVVSARLSGVVDSVELSLRMVRTLVGVGRPPVEVGFSPMTKQDTDFLRGQVHVMHEALALISIADISALVPLPNHAAHRLAAGIARLEVLHTELQETKNWGPLAEMRSGAAVFLWMGSLSACNDLLRAVQIELHRAVGKSAPHPTDQELQRQD